MQMLGLRNLRSEGTYVPVSLELWRTGEPQKIFFAAAQHSSNLL